MLQLVSPSLPVGAFSYSEGLEWLVHSEQITNESTLFNWLNSELFRGQIRLEAASQSFLRSSLESWQQNNDMRAISDLLEWDSWLLALRDSEEVRNQQKQMGKSLFQLFINLGYYYPSRLENCSWPIAWSCAGHAWKLTQLEVVEGYLYSWIANQLSAGLRLIPLGATEVQRIQVSFLPLIKSQAKELLTSDPHELWTGDIGSTMAQLSHPELYSRLFRS